MADDNIRVFLESFEEKIRNAGEAELAKRIRQIRLLPDPLAYLSKILTKQRTRKQDNSFEQRVTWFRNYTSEEGKKLGEVYAKNLASLTRKWNLEQSKVTALRISASVWTEFPLVFWDGEQPHDEIIRRSFNDLQRMTNIDPIKRKVLLVILSVHVEERQKQLPGWKDTVMSDSESCRPSFSLQSSLKKLTKQLWPDITDPEEESKKRKYLADYSRWGWKWRQLENRGMILSLAAINSSSFEKSELNGLHFKAIRSWVKTTSQFGITDILNKGWVAIFNCYREIRERRLAGQNILYGRRDLLQHEPGNSPRPHNQQAVRLSPTSPGRPPFLAADSGSRSESVGELSDPSSAESSVDVVEDDREPPSPKRQCHGLYNLRQVPSQACVGRSYRSSSTISIENLQSSHEILPETSGLEEEPEEYVIPSSAVEVQAASLLSSRFLNSAVNHWPTPNSKFASTHTTILSDNENNTIVPRMMLSNSHDDPPQYSIEFMNEYAFDTRQTQKQNPCNSHGSHVPPLFPELPDIFETIDLFPSF